MSYKSKTGYIVYYFMILLFVVVCWCMDALPTLTAPPVGPPLLRPCCLKSCCLDPRSCSRLSETRGRNLPKGEDDIRGTMQFFKIYIACYVLSYRRGPFRSYHLSFSSADPSTQHESIASLRNLWHRPAVTMKMIPHLFNRCDE